MLTVDTFAIGGSCEVLTMRLDDEGLYFPVSFGVFGVPIDYKGLHKLSAALGPLKEAEVNNTLSYLCRRVP